MENFEMEEAYRRAKRKVDNLKGFYWNLFSYIVVVPILIYVNYLTTWDEIRWFWFPMAGWGMGILFHAFSVFGEDRFFGKNWEERKIKEMMDKYNQQN